MADIRDPHRDQPLPTPGTQPVQDVLIRAVEERRDYGTRKYGRPLETHNGRDALTDAWEEALDLVTYLTQMRLERGDALPGAGNQPQATPQLGIAQHDKPVYKLVCDNTDCNSEDWTALDPDDEIKYFGDQQHARVWGRANGWEVGDRVLCPADAAEARERREQAEDIAAAVADALTEG